MPVGCPCGLGSRNQLAPFHNRPRLSEMSAGWGGGGQPGKLLTRELLGRGWRGPRLPDSYFGECSDGAEPWQGSGLCGSSELQACQEQRGTCLQGGGGDTGHPPQTTWPPLPSRTPLPLSSVRGPLNTPYGPWASAPVKVNGHRRAPLHQTQPGALGQPAYGSVAPPNPACSPES